MTIRVLAAMTLVMACMACEPAPPSAPPPGAAVRRDVNRGVSRAPERRPAEPGEPEPAEPAEASSARVRFRLGTAAAGPWLYPLDRTTIRFEDSSGPRTVPGTDLMTEQESIFLSPWYTVDTRGGLAVEVLVSDTVDTSVHANRIWLDAGGTWEVSLFVAARFDTACSGIYLAEERTNPGAPGGTGMGCLEPSRAP